jgi:hypothetical protein
MHRAHGRVADHLLEPLLSPRAGRAAAALGALAAAFRRVRDTHSLHTAFA